MRRREILKGGALVGLSAIPLVNIAAAATRPAMFKWKLAPPQAGGMSPAGLVAMREAVQKNIDSGNVAGAVTAVARHDKLVWLQAQGWADIDARKPMRTDSLFRMMSSTKVVTAVAVLMMVEEGRLALNDPVSKFIPSFRNQKVAVRRPGAGGGAATVDYVPAVRDITVLDLLTHTSGLSSVGSIPEVATLRGGLGDARTESLSTVIPKLGSLPLDFQPGALFRYSPLDGFDTLLYLVELVSGLPAGRFLHERLFEPLDMRNTFFATPASERDRIAQVYDSKNGKLVPAMPMFDTEPSRYVSGAGGLTSCAHDMLNFELMLLHRGSFNGRRLLKPETVALMTSDHAGALFRAWVPPLTGGNDFGLSVRILKDVAVSDGRAVGAFGWGGAYGTETWADPKLDLAAVMLIQGARDSKRMREDFTQALRSAIAV